MAKNPICPKCKGIMKKVKDKIKQDKIDFEAYQCTKCKEKLIDMIQLKKLASKYRELRKSKEVIFSKWGNSIAIRIPSDYAASLNIQEGKHAILTKTDKAIKIIPV